MSVNEEGVIAGSDSFWELEQYKRTVKRHEDGLKLCNELSQLIQERADLEKNYAKSLKSWAQKFGKALESGPEYGTMEAACKGVLSEADRVAELHLTVKDRLIGEIQPSIKTWKNENYTKKLVGPSTGTKELEELFKKAQKPWAKRYIKAMKAKKDYHTACKLEKTAVHQEGNAKNDTAVSQDQLEKHEARLKKMQDKIDKCKKDVDSSREKYKAALSELNSYNRKYTEDMMEVFNRAQDSEEKRLVFFKEMLFGVQKCLDLSDSSEYKQIHHQLLQTISQADYSKDLKWWAQNHGSDMPMNWPLFEEYSPEMHDISKKQKKGNVSGGDGITLTAISTRENSSPNNAPPAYDNYSVNNGPNNEPPSYQSQSSYASYNSNMSDSHESGHSGSMAVPGAYVETHNTQREEEDLYSKPIPKSQRQKSNESDQVEQSKQQDTESFDESAMTYENVSDPAAPKRDKADKKSKSKKDKKKKGKEAETLSVASAAAAQPIPEQPKQPIVDEPKVEEPEIEELEVEQPKVKPKVKQPKVEPVPEAAAQSNGGGQNPFGDEEWEEYPAPEIDESNGVPVRALYDYNGQEDDELTFKAGDIFLKLLDADEQGWCTGKKDSKTGLYPNNYVETV